VAAFVVLEGAELEDNESPANNPPGAALPGVSSFIAGDDASAEEESSLFSAVPAEGGGDEADDNAGCFGGKGGRDSDGGVYPPLPSPPLSLFSVMETIVYRRAFRSLMRCC